MYAVLQMLAQKVSFDFSQRCSHRFDLRHDVDAVAIVLDHLGDATDLTFDPFESRVELFCHFGCKATLASYVSSCACAMAEDGKWITVRGHRTTRFKEMMSATRSAEWW